MEEKGGLHKGRVISGGTYTQKNTNLKILILTITGVVMRYNDLFQFSQANCIHIKIVSLNKSDLYNTSI